MSRLQYGRRKGRSSPSDLEGPTYKSSSYEFRFEGIEGHGEFGYTPGVDTRPPILSGRPDVSDCEVCSPGASVDSNTRLTLQI